MRCENCKEVLLAETGRRVIQLTNNVFNIRLKIDTKLRMYEIDSFEFCTYQCLQKWVEQKIQEINKDAHKN